MGCYNKICMSLVLCLGLMFVGSNNVMAQTPDGLTPAQETDCDVLKEGAAKGLYGLCVAYCEAQDCDSDLFLANACKESNPRILANFIKKAGVDGPTMPCLKPAATCVCWEPEEVENLQICTITDTASTLIRDDCSGDRAHLQNFSGRLSCLFIAVGPDEDGNKCGSSNIRFKSLNAEEYQSCRDSIAAHPACN